MAELAERVARLEERYDSVTAGITDLRAAVNKLDAHMEAGFAEMRTEFSTLRRELGSELAEIRGESSGIRAEMNTQFRWLMGGIGGATLTILVSVLAAIFARG